MGNAGSKLKKIFFLFKQAQVQQDRARGQTGGCLCRTSAPPHPIPVLFSGMFRLTRGFGHRGRGKAPRPASHLETHMLHVSKQG